MCRDFYFLSLEMNYKFKFILTLIVSIIDGIQGATFDITDVKCHTNAEYNSNTECKLISNGKDASSINLRTNLIKAIEHVKIHIQSFMMKQGSYQPGTVDLIIDGCDFLDGKELAPISKLMYELLKDKTGAKYSCPLKGPLELKNVQIKSQIIPFIIPNGEYQLRTRAFWDQIEYGAVLVNFSVTNVLLG